MLGSAMGEKSYSLLRSNTKVATIMEKGVVLDFGCDEDGQTRRSSFLGNIDENQHKINDNIDGKGSKKTDKKEHVIKFVTGSKYVGHWNQLGMSGKGVYRYPHGVIYDGYFNRNGEFHGTGMLLYPNGDRIEGVWKNGRLQDGWQFITKENNAYDENYCQMPDRRFQIEIQHDLQPADQEYISPNPDLEIPKGCYDAGIGIYDPKLRVIKAYKKPDVFKPEYEYRPWADEERNRQYRLVLNWTPSENDFYNLLKRSKGDDEETDQDVNLIPLLSFEQWIKKYCRKNSTAAVGYMPEYFEMWRTGALRENYLHTTPSTDFHPAESVMYQMLFSPEFSNNNYYGRPKSGSNIKMLSQMFYKKNNSHMRQLKTKTRRRHTQN